jgi:DNA mismatch repair protein MutS
MQMSFFNLDDPLLEEIKEEILNLDINTITNVDETE